MVPVVIPNGAQDAHRVASDGWVNPGRLSIYATILVFYFMSSSEKRVIFVAGPTASGKSKEAIRLAKLHNGEVISVDSRQVYRGLDIGTEKITPEEMDGVPHHLIDIRDVTEVYSAGDFVADSNSIN